MESKKWGIVGGGIMGMTLAHRLAQQGHNVTIFEAASELGGLVSSWKLDDIEWDKFYHVILLSDSRTRGLLKELGLENEIRWVETKTGFYIDGQLYSMSDIIEFLRFPALNLIDKFRLGLTIIIASRIKNWKRLEKIPVTSWLKKWSGSHTYNKIWLPLLRAKLGDSYQKTSAVFIWATIQRLYDARRSGLKKEMFGYLPGGYKDFIKAFERKLLSQGVKINTQHKCEKINVSKNGLIKIFSNSEDEEDFQQVVLTLPSPVSGRICEQLLETEIDKLNNIEYLSVICVAVLLKRSISKFYITNITDSKIPFTGVIEMSALVDKDYLGGNHLIYLPKYLVSGDPLFNLPDNEIKSSFLINFKLMYPSLKDEDIKFVGVARAKYVIPIAKIDYSKTLPDIKTSIPGVYIINTSHIKDGTLNVNETIRVAETKLDEILN